MSSFSRVFMRAARYQRGVNPVQNALGLQGTSRYMNGVRNYAAFTRDKPHVNVGMCCSLCPDIRQLIECRNHWSR
jgi:elongation factor Tu